MVKGVGKEKVSKCRILDIFLSFSLSRLLDRFDPI